MDQVAKAMGVVDQVTQRNASAAEELSSTAEEMSSQAESLQQLMAFFQVSALPQAAHPAASARPAARRLAEAGALASGTGLQTGRVATGQHPRLPPPSGGHATTPAEAGYRRF